jgi:hypothetical protein
MVRIPYIGRKKGKTTREIYQELVKRIEDITPYLGPEDARRISALVEAYRAQFNMWYRARKRLEEMPVAKSKAMYDPRFRDRPVETRENIGGLQRQQELVAEKEKIALEVIGERLNETIHHYEKLAEERRKKRGIPESGLLIIVLLLGFSFLLFGFLNFYQGLSSTGFFSLSSINYMTPFILSAAILLILLIIFGSYS